MIRATVRTSVRATGCLAILLAASTAHADSDGVQSAVVLVLDQGPPLSDTHPLVRNELRDGIAEGDENDQLGIVTYGRSAKVVVPLQPLGDKKAFARVEKIPYSRGNAMLDGLMRAYSMLKASKVERRRVVLVTHSEKPLPAAVVKLAAKFRAAGIETAAMGFQNAAWEHLVKFAPESEVLIGLDSPIWHRFFRVSMGWIRCNDCP